MTRKPASFLLVLAVALSACAGSAAVEADPFVRVGASQFADAMAQASERDRTVIDLRTNEEVAAGFIDATDGVDWVQVDFYASDFEAKLDALPKDVHYLIYCNSGNRSGTTLRIMKDLGFTRVTELGGGIQAWLAAELPVVRP